MPDLLEALAGVSVIDLAQPLDSLLPASPSLTPFSLTLKRGHGEIVREDGVSGAIDAITLSGHTGTHIDALCHIASHGKLHGGADAVAAVEHGRFAVHGVETLAPIVCRGVLLDLAVADPARPITAADLDRAAEAQGVTVQPGDAVLIRTGWSAHIGDPEAFVGHASGTPGPDASAARWLVERGVRVTGSDTLAYEWLPPGKGHSLLPVHALLLVDHGIPIIEVLALDELSARGASTFGFVAAPLRIVGGTGSPLRPLALIGGADA
jgi:kynurenine formamidase